MVDLLSRSSWFFFNIGVPVFAPIALLPLLRFSRYYQHVARGIARRSIQDGQLFWVVISMCASACYEIGGLVADVSARGKLVLMLAALLWHVLFIIAASILVCLGSADAAARLAHNGSEGESDGWLMWLSILVTVIVATSFFASHYSFT
ncbi:hypothetical protein BCY88_23760 [Paraburkholderia fungorum]|uniref:Uncharacterized protein n=2 Tax=Paraburkholderia fungorum TaxID=134537 RepID=A0A3R7LBF9_9BURK|nr:hypothetical protein BCY88_23760 [Paraburkholderia fungorum]